MLILSTFTSDYLQNPALKYPHPSLLKSLFEKFTTEPIETKYVNKNLIGELVGLKIEKLQSCAILFRLFDFLEKNLIIDIAKLEENLKLILKQIILIKQKSALPFIVFLCPSPEKIYNEELKKIEEKYIEKFNKNKIHILSLSNIKENYEIINFENPIEGETHIPYLPEFYTAMACLLARKLHAIKQKNFKLIAVDCDNTLWTGVAAENGSERVVFEEHNLLLQEYLVKQQENGKIICLCSKNDEQTVIDVFNQREAEMPLKLKHLSKYNKINWKPKSENIKELAKELNLFPDSFCFIDDNPIEINEVNQSLDVFCITMPQNLKEYKNHWGFDIDEHLIITETDKNRDAFYSQKAIKTELATQFNDPVEYLRSPELGQFISISKIDFEEDIETIQRVSQLSGKTNQFNIFPKSKAIEINEINSIINSKTRDIFIGRIKDNFSSEDITAVAVSSLSRNSIIVNSFFLSCRVFNRGMEYEMLKYIAQFALEEGKKYIKINFKKSQKNNSASNFLNNLSEEKNPKSKYLLDKTKAYVWLHTSLKFFLKKLNLYLDFSEFSLDEESILTLSARRIASIDLDSIIRKVLNFSQQASKLHSTKLTLDSNKLTEKYLVELKQITSSLESLSNKFFIDNKVIKSITALDTRINELCNHLLGDEGQDKSLVARGLDSLKATQLRLALYENEKLIITIQMLLDEKTTSATLINHIKPQEKSIEIEIIAKNDNFYNQTLPVSFQQQRIWFAERQESADNSINYHITACYRAKNLDIHCFKKACQDLIKLYDVFGTTFFMQGSELKQLILEPEKRPLNFQVKNLKPETSLEGAIQLETSQLWTMESKAPLIRFIIFEDGENFHIFIHVHHAIFDAVSLKNCLDTLSKIYQNTLESNIPRLIDYPPQYIEFIYDQQKKLEDEASQTTIFNFWKDTLSNIDTVTTLPYDLFLPTFKPATELTAERFCFTLPSQDLVSLKILAQSADVTCFSVLSALLSLLISSYTYQENITLITATNGRGGHPSFDKMVGFFVNLLVQQFNLEKNHSFVTYLKQVNQKLLTSQAFQDIPFDRIQGILDAQGVKNILSSPAFIYQSYAIPELRLDNGMAELEIPKQSIILDKRETCRFGHFTLFAQEKDEELIFILEYAEDLFSASFIKGFADNFLHTIKNVSNNPNQKLQDISVVCDEERSKLISVGQGPQLHYDKNDNLVNRFKRNVEKYPDHTALCYGEIRLSYKEVDQQATNLAHALIQKGVQQGDYVGIFLEANHLFFVAELAILKVAAVFIPLSKKDPYFRLKSIIGDAKIKFFIIDDNFEGLFATDFKDRQLISINSINTEEDLISLNSLPLSASMEDSACVLYTSGSTGTPKGVILPHKAIFRVVESPKFVKILSADKIAQTANQAFDAAQLECWLAWNNGASLVVFNKDTILNRGLLQPKLAAEKITHMWLTAGLFNMHANAQPDLFRGLKYLIVGGDVVHKVSVLKVLNYEDSPTIINGYGPTETGIFASESKLDRETLNRNNSVPLGEPTNDTRVKGKTCLGAEAPYGAKCELIIVIGWRASYLNSTELNNECFEGNSESREYKSGDLVRFNRDQQIMFEGRKNKQQIKINGNLVALAEVRNCLSKHPAIKQVEIIIKLLDGFNKLIAFYVMNEEVTKPTNHDFYNYLREKLPPYMTPAIYKEIDTFLTTANGKLDIKWLEEYPLIIDDNDNPKEISEDEKTLLKIFKKELSGFPDNIKANFFAFGGSSIQAVSLITKINNSFKEINLNTGDLYANPTPQGIAVLIKKPKANIKKSLLRLLKKGDDSLPTLVCLHTAGGSVNEFCELIERTNLNNSCYGIEDPLLVNGELKKLSMEEMAGNYFSMIEDEIQGPFILTGYSFGGMLALEMAAQNENAESKNNNLLGVVLLDTWVVSCASQVVKDKLIEDVLKYCAERREKADIHKGSSEIMEKLQELCEHHQDIGFKFIPKKLESSIVYLFKATNLDENFYAMNEQDEDKNNYLSNYINANSLKENEKLFKKIEVEATHYNLLEILDKNNLPIEFPICISEITQKTCKYKKLTKTSSTFFNSVFEINNDSQFTCSAPRIKQ